MSRTHCWCPGRWQGKELLHRQDTVPPGTPSHNWFPFQQAAGYKTRFSLSQKKVPIKTTKKRGVGGADFSQGNLALEPRVSLPGHRGEQNSLVRWRWFARSSQYFPKCGGDVQRVFQNKNKNNIAPLSCVRFKTHEGQRQRNGRQPTSHLNYHWS